jgi:penicillin V acylase-like amidase (Ntn superfamily)
VATTVSPCAVYTTHTLNSTLLCVFLPTQLITTVYPNATNRTTDLAVDFFCEWALATCSSASELAAAVNNRSVTVHGPSVAGGQHFVVRDATGASAVVEFLAGQSVVTTDLNDGGTTGYGIMTNEPEIG